MLTLCCAATELSVNSGHDIIKVKHFFEYSKRCLNDKVCIIMGVKKSLNVEIQYSITNLFVVHLSLPYITFMFHLFFLIPHL